MAVCRWYAILEIHWHWVCIRQQLQETVPRTVSRHLSSVISQLSLDVRCGKIVLCCWWVNRRQESREQPMKRYAPSCHIIEWCIPPGGTWY